VSLRCGAALLLAVLMCAGCAPEVVIGYAPVPQTMDAGDDAGGVDAGGMDAGGTDAGGTDADDAAVDGGDGGDSGAGPDAEEDAGEDAEVPLPEITWETGAHPGNDLPQYLAFGTWRDRPLDYAHLFPDRASWDGLTAPAWPVDMFAPFEGELILSEPPYPTGMGATNAACAAGDYNAEWVQLGTFLVNRGRGSAILRLGWGPNDNDHEWAVAEGATPGTVDQADLDAWKLCFQNVVNAVRSTAPDIRIDWTINPIGAPWIATYDPFLTYPGDDYVDYVGIEVFDMYPPARTDAEWDAVCNAPTGLCTLMEFARAHGKQVGVAEWSVVSCAGDGQLDNTGNTGGDNPFFVRKVVETFAANADVMAYEAYFEDGGGEVCSDLFDDSHPESAAKYLELYRPR